MKKLKLYSEIIFLQNRVSRIREIWYDTHAREKIKKKIVSIAIFGPLCTKVRGRDPRTLIGGGPWTLVQGALLS